MKVLTFLAPVIALLLCAVGCAALKGFVLGVLDTPEGVEAVKTASEVATLGGGLIPPPFGTIIQVLGGLLPVASEAAVKIAKA